jgi:hypothetical protein
MICENPAENVHADAEMRLKGMLHALEPVVGVVTQALGVLTVMEAGEKVTPDEDCGVMVIGHDGDAAGASTLIVMGGAV